MLGTFASTGELEQNFSFAEMYTSGRKGSVTVENLRPGALSETRL